MKYNSHLQRWEGNENVLEHFEIPPPLQTLDNAIMLNSSRKRKAANIGIGAIIRELRLAREEQAA